jgi:hypothetical protein
MKVCIAFSFWLWNNIGIDLITTDENERVSIKLDDVRMKWE